MTDSSREEYEIVLTSNYKMTIKELLFCMGVKIGH